MTGHSAFRKGAWLFDVDIVDIPVGADFQADAGAMIEAMSDRTVLAVVSAPSYARRRDRPRAGGGGRRG